MNLETLKNNFAQEHGYKDFESFVIGTYSPDNISKAWAIGDLQAAMEEIYLRAQKALNIIYLACDEGDGEVLCAFTDENQCKSEVIESGCGMQTVRLVWNEENLIR